MAARVAFKPVSYSWPYFEERVFEFEWVKGQASSQQIKGLKNFHNSILREFTSATILEVSTLSDNSLGKALSAFNLRMQIYDLRVSVENIYQSSKIFSAGGPYTDLLKCSPLDARRDPRLQESGELMGFKFEEKIYELIDSPNFYDYLYIRGLSENLDLLEKSKDFDFFTDFKYSQTSLIKKSGRSFNCQARALAMAVGASKNDSLANLLKIVSESLVQSKALGPRAATLFD